MSILVSLLINAAALWVATQVVDGISFTGDIPRLLGVAIVFVYDAVVSLIILFVINMVIGLRVTPEIEREGLDVALHGETVQ